MMKRIIIPIMLVIVAAFFATACSKAAPACADEKTKKKVIEIALEDLKNR